MPSKSDVLTQIAKSIGNKKELKKIPYKYRIAIAWYTLGKFAGIAKAPEWTERVMKAEMLRHIEAKYDIKVTLKRKKNG